MTLRYATRLLLLATLACLTGLMGSNFAKEEQEAKTPGELLPAEAVLYVRLDGTEGHEEAYEQTAAYQALNDSGLSDLIEKALANLSDHEETAGIGGIIEHLRQYGFSGAISVDAPVGQPFQVWATVVAPFAGEGVDLLADVLTQISQGKAKIKETKIKGRLVKYVDLDNPLVDLGWWKQGESLMIAAGMNAVANSIAVADGERPNITSHRLWKQYDQVEDDFDVTQKGWLDFRSLAKQFGEREIPLPANPEAKTITLNQLLDLLGLSSLDHAAVLSGYRGESLWSECLIDAPGQRTGLLALLDQPTFVIDDLPAIPLSNVGIMACSFDTGRAFEGLLKVVRDLAALGPAEGQKQIDQGLAAFEEQLGFTPQTLLASLGTLHCLYSDTSQSAFGLGGLGMVQVKDKDTLISCLRKAFNRLVEEVEKQERGAIVVEEVEKGEQTHFRIRFPKAQIITPTLSVDENWLIVGLLPQSVIAQQMRMNGILDSWAIQEDLGEILDTLPEEMTSIQLIDPAGTYRTLIGLAPTLLGLMEQGIRSNGSVPEDWRLPIDVSQIPPAELVTQPLFMNVGIGTVDENGWHGFSRESLPGLPLLGGTVGPGLGVGTTSVLAALLLPAVQNAREAARRSQSRNNLKQIGLAIYNYTDSHNALPTGTVPNADLPVEERLSWFVSLLPYLDQAQTYQKIDQKSGWQAADNAEALSTIIPTFLNPSSQSKTLNSPYGKINYVGMGGLGKDGPTLPVSSNRAGAFGDDRETHLRDFKDGTSYTIMVTDSSEVAPWGEGGRATVRPLTQQPYINGPDGIGSPHPGGIQALFGDGGIRFISENIDAKTMEAFITINGGERIDDF